MRMGNDDSLGWVGAISALERPGGACLLPDGEIYLLGRWRASEGL